MTIARPVAALAAITALVTSCSDTADDAAGAGKDDKPQETGIVATAAGGMKVEFKDFTVTCRPSEDDQPDAQIVSATSGWDFNRGPGGPTVPTEPAMLIEAADTTGRETLDLPHVEEWGNEKTFLVGFITEVGKEVELSSAEEQATGQIEVISASCDPEPRLEVRIDGTFGSEVSDATVTVKGYVSAD